MIATRSDMKAAEMPHVHHPPSPLAVWLSPERLRQYQWNKAIGGLLISMIFAGWLVLQWSNPVMRLLAATLIAMTLWIVTHSILEDLKRHRGRRIAIADGVLSITTPEGHTEVRLAEVSHAQWQDDPQPSLGFYNHRQQKMAGLDEAFLSDQAEARAFLEWARNQADLSFQVCWPDTPYSSQTHYS